MDAQKRPSGIEPLPVFLFNGLVGLGEYAVPLRLLVKLDPHGRTHRALKLPLALAGCVVGTLFVLWTAGRILWGAWPFHHPPASL